MQTQPPNLPEINSGQALKGEWDGMGWRSFLLAGHQFFSDRSLRRTLVLHRHCEASEAISCRALSYAAFMLCQEIASFLAMTIHDPNVQVSDTTGDDSSNAVGIKKTILHFYGDL